MVWLELNVAKFVILSGRWQGKTCGGDGVAAEANQ